MCDFDNNCVYYCIMYLLCVCVRTTIRTLFGETFSVINKGELC